MSPFFGVGGGVQAALRSRQGDRERNRCCDAKVIIITGFHPDYAALAGKLGTIRGLNSVTTLVKPVGAGQLRTVLE